MVLKNHKCPYSSVESVIEELKLLEFISNYHIDDHIEMIHLEHN